MDNEQLFHEIKQYLGQQEALEKETYVNHNRNTVLLYAQNSPSKYFKAQIFLNILHSPNRNNIYVFTSKSGIVVRGPEELIFQPYHVFIPPGFDQIPESLLYTNIYMLELFAKYMQIKVQKIKHKQLSSYFICMHLEQEYDEDYLLGKWQEFRQGDLTPTQYQIISQEEALSVFSQIPWNLRKKILFTNKAQVHIWHYLPIPVFAKERIPLQVGPTCTSLLSQAGWLKNYPESIFDTQGNCLTTTTITTTTTSNTTEREPELNLDRMEIFTQELVSDLSPEERQGLITINNEVFSLVHLLRYLQDKKEDPLTRQYLNLESNLLQTAYFTEYETNKVDIFCQDDDCYLTTPAGKVLLMKNIDPSVYEIITYLWSADKMRALKVKFPSEPLCYLNDLVINFFARDFTELTPEEIYSEVISLWRLLH